MHGRFPLLPFLLSLLLCAPVSVLLYHNSMRDRQRKGEQRSCCRDWTLTGKKSTHSWQELWGLSLLLLLHWLYCCFVFRQRSKLHPLVLMIMTSIWLNWQASHEQRLVLSATRCVTVIVILHVMGVQAVDRLRSEDEVEEEKRILLQKQKLDQLQRMRGMVGSGHDGVTAPHLSADYLPERWVPSPLIANVLV